MGEPEGTELTVGIACLTVGIPRPSVGRRHRDLPAGEAHFGPGRTAVVEGRGSSFFINNKQTYHQSCFEGEDVAQNQFALVLLR